MKYKELLAICVCFSLFSRKLFRIILFGFDLDLFAYPVYIFLLIYMLKQGRYRVKFAAGVFFTLCFLGTLYLANGYPIRGFLKTAIPLFLIFTSLYSYLYNEKLSDFFATYIKVSTWVAVIGLLQVFLKVTIGVGLFSNYPTIDLHSIVSEPSHYVVVILPVFIYTFFYYKDYGIQFWLFLITLLLTFKLTAFASILGILIFAKFKIKYLIFLLPITYFTYQYLMTIPEYIVRIGPVVSLLTNEEYPFHLHGTALSFISNLKVAFFSADNNFFLGGGLGSHPYAYDRYFETRPWIGAFEHQYGMNKNSAHSLLIRVFSELGWIGLGFVFFVFSRAFKRAKKDKASKIIFFAVMAHFIAKSIKLGSYIDYGTPIFFCIIIILIFKPKGKKEIESIPA